MEYKYSVVDRRLYVSIGSIREFGEYTSMVDVDEKILHDSSFDRTCEQNIKHRFELKSEE